MLTRIIDQLLIHHFDTSNTALLKISYKILHSRLKEVGILAKKNSVQIGWKRGKFYSNLGWKNGNSYL